ncbi:hypothetical protein [Streptomyces sp. NA02536]|nr:hypothetical protein [Streptomyces sp. NA02536]QKW04475.1 hypothetical protein HUT14_33855 [Streptomyces sp. NA02536]
MTTPSALATDEGRDQILRALPDIQDVADPKPDTSPTADSSPRSKDTRP